jgi:hypothetical protein
MTRQTGVNRRKSNQRTQPAGDENSEADSR